MSVRLFVAFTLATVASPLVAAESFDRRSRSEPEVAVQDGGRSGACDAVRFSPDGKFLFAAGDDKVVTSWPHTAAGLDTDPDKVRVLRWPAWREQRGGIKDLAVSPDGKRVLVGGYGLRVATVAILEVDPPTDGGVPRIELTWPKTRPGLDSFRTVETVAFAPDGKTVAFATADGSVWLWTPERRKAADEVDRWYNTPLWVGRHAQFVKADEKHWREVETPHSRRLFFRTPHELVSVTRTGEVWQFDVSAPDKLTDVRDRAAAPAKRLFTLGDGKAKFEVFYAAYGPTADLLAVAPDRSPRVLVRPLDAAKPAVELKLLDRHFARTVAVSKDGAVAVAAGTAVRAKAGEPQFHNDADDEVRVYRRPAADAKPDAVMKVRGQAEALAFHPTLDQLAVGGGDADEVTLYDLAKPTEPLSVARGAGRKPWELALSADGQVLGVRTQRNATADRPNGRGAKDWTWVNLPRLQPQDNAPKGWAAARDTADDWTVVPDKDDRDVWVATHPTVGRLILKHETKQFNKPTCYTFLPAVKDKDRPTRLLVGHYYGASLYELPAKAGGAELPPTRIYIGHAGEVLSIAAADDAKGGWFVTGGSDHTLAAYTLTAWPSNPALGVAFEKVGQTLKVAAVDVGSPGWEAGLQKDDELVLLAAGTGRVYDRRPPAKTANPADSERDALDTAERRPGDDELNTPDAAAKLLANPLAAGNLYFRVKAKGGGERDAQTGVRQRPLWKLFPAFDDSGRMVEWVAWVWKGSYYHDESTNAGRLVGWHLNGPTTKDAPMYHKLADFPMYRRGDAVRRLMATRNLADTLELVLGKNPLPPKFDDRLEPPPVRLAVDRFEVTAKPVAVTVKVNRQRADVDLLPERVELWVNDHRLKEWTGLNPAKEFEGAVEVKPDQLRAGDNILTVRTYNRAGGSAEQVVGPITNRNPAAEPTLLGLAVGVNDYKAHRDASGVRGVVGNLKYAAADAQAVADTFTPYVGKGRYFPDGRLTVKRDAAVAREDLFGELARLKKTARPDDLLVLFLAGHGQLIGDWEDKAKGQKGTRVIGKKENPDDYTNVRFAFCCPTFNTDTPADAIVTDVELYNELVGLNCRKVVLLDVCHAGSAVQANVIKRLIPNGQGPFVMAACGPGQSSHELPDLKHGLFTEAVLEATTRSPAENAAFHLADANKDGKLSCEELFRYVEKRVIEERKGQTPTCFPDRGRLPKATVVAAAPVGGQPPPKPAVGK